jgi:hypothetical protein
MTLTANSLHVNKGNALSSLFFNFAFECAFRKVQDNRKGLKLTQCLVYDDNLLTDTINTIRKNKEALSDASQEVGPYVNTEKWKYLMCCLWTEWRRNSQQ